MSLNNNRLIMIIRLFCIITSSLICSMYNCYTVVTIIWHSLIVSQWPPWPMTSVGHEIVVWVRFIPWYDIGNIMTGTACGAKHSYPSGAPDFTSGFHRSPCCPVICGSFFHVIVLSFWILSFDWFFCLIVWYLYFLLIWNFFFKNQTKTRWHCKLKPKYVLIYSFV